MSDNPYIATDSFENDLLAAHQKLRANQIAVEESAQPLPGYKLIERERNRRLISTIPPTYVSGLPPRLS